MARTAQPVTAAASLWRTHGPSARAPTDCSPEPRDTGRQSPSKLSRAGQGHQARDLPRVEMLKLGPWALQGACKSTVTRRTTEGSQESVSAAFSISQRDWGPRKANPTASGVGLKPGSRAWCRGQSSGAPSPPPPEEGPGVRQGHFRKAPWAQHRAPCSPACPSQTRFTFDHHGLSTRGPGHAQTGVSPSSPANGRRAAPTSSCWFWKVFLSLRLKRVCLMF